jgi:membrane protein implicated in regulation of membrane protease activity
VASRLTDWSHRYRGRLEAEIVLALVVGGAAFVLAALVSAAARSQVPDVLLGAFFILVVVAVAHFAGILYAGSRGSGIIGPKDRVEALGGTISVVSPPGEGTTLHVRLPGGPGAAPTPQRSALGARDVKSAA